MNERILIITVLSLVRNTLLKLIQNETTIHLKLRINEFENQQDT